MLLITIWLYKDVNKENNFGGHIHFPEENEFLNTVIQAKKAVIYIKLDWAKTL